tara:strand:- start:265 stop:927 length:663 start_codon:yes stop_codon:yes gene_type:complete
MNNLFKEEYFKTPIYWLDKPEWVKGLNKSSDPFIKEAKKNINKDILIRNKKFGNKKDHGFVAHSNSLTNQEGFGELQKFIIDTAEKILIDQGFNLQNYMMGLNEFWVQEFAKAGGGSHDLHTHWNGHISGFYFLKASERTSFPVFEDPRSGRNMNLLYEKEPAKITNATSKINYKIEPGKMIFFNSYVPHRFPVDNGYEPFRFIHWNISAMPRTLLSNVK